MNIFQQSPFIRHRHGKLYPVLEPMSPTSRSFHSYTELRPDRRHAVPRRDSISRPRRDDVSIYARNTSQSRQRWEKPDDVDPELRRLASFVPERDLGRLHDRHLLPVRATYIVPTYMMLGLAVVYQCVCTPPRFPLPLPAWTVFTWPRLAGISCGFLVAVECRLVPRMFVRYLIVSPLPCTRGEGPVVRGWTPE